MDDSGAGVTMLSAIKTSRRCAFCEKSEWGVEYLVAGPSSFICDECVGAAAALLKARNSAGEGANDPPLAIGATPDRYAHALLRKHFAPAGIVDIVTSSRTFPIRMRADLQKALDVLFAPSDAVAFYGYQVRYSYETCTFATVLDDSREAVTIAPVRYEDVDIGEDRPVACLENGLWLVTRDALRYAVLLAPHSEHGARVGSHLEVAALAGGDSQCVSSEVFGFVEEALERADSYRGKVLSLEAMYSYSGHASGIRVHRLDAVERDDLVLPESTLALLERNVVDFARKRSALAAYDMSTKKGLLFYGPPGTGKTFSIRYLATRLPGHTTLLMTAEQIGLLREYVALARLLSPSMIVIEDADLIARERTAMTGACEESLLNRLLNEMDGLAEDAAMIFVLTTNRPETIEPAIAGRPGRIDQAIEFSLPDDAGRRRLAKVYGRALSLSDDLVEDIAAKTKNVSPAFIKELMRRATQFHIDRAGDGSLARRDVDNALAEMLFAGGRLNVKLLGGDVGAEPKSGG